MSKRERSLLPSRRRREEEEEEKEKKRKGKKVLAECGERLNFENFLFSFLWISARL